MGKSQTMFREHIVNRDEFMEVSTRGQCFYFHVGFDADNIGELSGIKRLARGYGFGDDEIRELLEAGYLLEVEGRWFITHYYENNAKPTNAKMRAAAENLWKKRPASLAYEGEQFNSKLVSLTLDEQQTNLSQELDRNCSGSSIDSGTDNVFPSSTSKERVSGGVGSGGEGSAPHSEPCPRCGVVAFVEHELGITKVDCSSCGFYTIDENGEIIG